MSDKYSEQVFDYLLEEMLKGPKPPDLRERIEAAWDSEKSAARAESEKLIVAELVTPDEVPGSQPVTKRQERTPVPPRTADDSGKLRKSKRNSARHSNRSRSPAEFKASRYKTNQSRAWVHGVLATIAASLLLFAGWRTIFSDSGKVHLVLEVSPDRAAIPHDESLASVVQSPADNANAIRSSDSLVTDEASKSITDEPIQPLDLNTLPFADQSSTPNSQDPRSETAAVAAIQTTSMSGTDIVAAVDERLANVWKQMGVLPSKELGGLERAKKLHLALMGSPLNPSAFPMNFIDAQGELDTLGYATSLIKRRKAADHWASLMVRQWLQGGAMPSAGEDVLPLTTQLAQQIVTSKNWGDIIRNLIGGELPAEATQSDQPTAILMGALAGGGNHRLATRIGTNFLNVNFACAKCHDGTLTGPNQIEVANIPMENSLQPIQQTYWSLIASLNGIDAVGNGFRGQRTVSDHQQALFSQKEPTVFFDLPDGRLQIAEARLPDGHSWHSSAGESPRQALATWIADSRSSDYAIVNQTWKLLFGRHLVPQIDAVDVVAIPSRWDTLDFLASQFRAHNRDLKQLICWIASTNAWGRSSVELTHSQWVAASEQDLERLQLAELVFAAGPSLSFTGSPQSLDSYVSTVMKWSASARMDEPQVLLGQPVEPSSDKSAKQSPQTNQTPRSLPPMSFAIHGQIFTSAEKDYVAHLISSPKLSWPQRVAHIVQLNELVALDSRTQQLADDLLNHHAGDQEAALLSLLWSIKNLTVN